MNEKIFRKSALDRLSSPEQLDMAITVMKPRAWLILAGLIVILLAVGIWGAVGKIESTISAIGMITSSGGSQEVIHSYAGMVTDIGVKSGTTVKRGDVIARISQNDVVNKIIDLKYDLNVLNSIDLSKFDPVTMVFSPKSDSVSTLYEQACLLKNGLAGSLSAGQFDTARKLEISKNQSAISYYQNLLMASSEIVSPADGVVSNIYITKDSSIVAGQSVMSVMQRDELTSQLQAIIYEDYRNVRGIATGEKVKIIPSGLTQDNGFLMGTVISVADAPSTPEGMQKSLGSPQVVAAILGVYANSKSSTQNSYVEIRVALDVDPSNATGYKWSVKNPPVTRLNANSMCDAKIVIGETSPLGLLL
jgi:HlyD family secretion protein